ncbi:MAG: radical SAM protein [Oligoflexia bacterium]|nr:radical SAM protein [Oligoflexia bacterium]
MEQRFKKIYLEIGNICNLQCSFCPVVEREKFQLNSSQLEQILMKISGYSERVCFHLMGEPLAHKSFADFVKIAEDLNVSLEITTNGTLLNEQNKNALKSKAIVQINFSLQSFPDNFPSANANQYYQNIFLFSDEINRENSELFINFRLWNLSHVEDNFKNLDLLKKIGEFFKQDLSSEVNTALIKSKKIRKGLYIHFDTRFLWPNLNSQVEQRESGTCHGGTHQIGIHADGTVVPCCLDKEAKINLGNIHAESLEQILHKDRYLRLVHGFKVGKLVEPLCRTCDFAKRFDRKLMKSNEAHTF